MDALSHKEGIITLSREGKQGMGIARPYPGFSQETLDEAIEQIEALGPDVLAKKVPLSALYPSVEFAFRSALADIENPLAVPTCKIHGLYREDRPWQHFSVLKVKVGHLDVQEAVNLLSQFPMRLRIDFNQKWEINAVLKLCEQVNLDKVDYFEEPTKDKEALKHFPYPLAFDETLLQPVDFSAFPSLKALILKPTLLGDITPFLSLGYQTILSSCFEGKEGVDCLKKMAARYDLLHEYHGLDTL